MKKTAFGLFLLFLFSACSTVPITGRKRINIVSDSQVLPTSFKQYASFLSENKKSSDLKSTAKIVEIGKKISKAVDAFMRKNHMEKEADAYRWEFNLIEDETVNAWCMPGGKVVFYTGILPIAQNADGIAAIMGHEIAHAFAKHGQERMSTVKIQSLGDALLTGTKKSNSREKEIWRHVYGVGSRLGALKFSRKHEIEADKLGMVFMILAGYNPEEAVHVWERMQAQNKSKTPEFLSTHPSNARRIQTLRDFIPEAERLAQKTKQNR